MSLLGLVVLLLAVGVLLYCIEHYVPLDATIKRIIHIVVILVVVLILLQAFGILDALRGLRVPRL
jgi:hypothetical protein